MATIAPKISLDSKFQLFRSSNSSYIDNSSCSNFCHQEGIGAIFNFCFSVCFLCVMFFLTPERAPKASPYHLFSNRNKFILVYIIGTKWRHSILCQKCFKECLFTDSESVHNILFPDSVSVLNILFNELQTWTHCHWDVNVTITP